MKAGNLLGHEDAVLEAAMCQLEPGGDVTDRKHARQVRAQSLVDQYPATFHGHALLLEAHAGCVWASSNRNEEQVGIEGLAVLKSDVHAGVVLGCRREAHAE